MDNYGGQIRSIFENSSLRVIYPLDQGYILLHEGVPYMAEVSTDNPKRIHISMIENYPITCSIDKTIEEEITCIYLESMEEWLLQVKKIGNASILSEPLKNILLDML